MTTILDFGKLIMDNYFYRMKTTLLILAAGMGSRYGGMKQVDPFGPSGETITDYSIYDAIRAGFDRFIFVISPGMEEDFINNYIKKFPSNLEVDYVIQSIEDLPEGFTLSPDRVKPWGTAHAVLMAKGKIREPFAVINADDYYGRESYRIMYDFLIRTSKEVPGQYCMVGFELQKTVSKHGSVARGICKVDDHGFLKEIVERTRVYQKDGGIVFELPDGTVNRLEPMETVSMNLFGFTPDFFGHIEERFGVFLKENISNNGAELFIPLVVDHLINSGEARMSVLQTPESWFGVTYKEDKPKVLKAIRELVDQGIYPESLWD